MSAAGTYRFERPVSRVVVDLVATPLGAVVFGALALAILAGLIRIEGPERFLFAGMAGFFALLLGVGSVVTFRRGLRRTILEVNESGIWTPEMGFLAWSDVAEVRRESYLAPAGGRGGGPRVMRRERLGIVPRAGAEVSSSKAAGLGLGMARGYYGFVGRIAGAEVPSIDHLAPHGIEDYELSVPLDDVVASISHFRPVVDTGNA